jgi:signal transduction histidine kinase
MFEILKSGVSRSRLSAANEALEQKVNTASRLAMLGELSAALMHDMSQPLQVIESGIGVADEIVQGDERTISEELKDLREAITDAGLALRHLKELAHNVKGLMRQQETTLTPTRLEQVLQECDVLLSRLAATRRVELEVVVPPDLPLVMIDRVQVAQIVLNLASNACDAMSEQATRTLRIEVEPEEGGWQTLVVTDSGPGIPEQLQARMFEAFFTTKAEGKGTGLGLSIVRRIVQAHRGDLTVTSAPGEGCVFRIRFIEAEAVRAAA